MLTLVYTFNYLDRKVLAIVAEPMRRELHLTDTQLGIVSGLAFALFYGTMGLPLAALADRTRRVTIVAGCCAVWSVFTALCGAVGGFWQLLLARIGVASGEAGGGPPSYSIISDYFEPRRRGTALAIYALGVPFGVIAGSAAGAYVASIWGWRWTFVVVGAPGVVLAAAMLLFVREPTRGALDPSEPTASARPFWVAIGGIVRRRTLIGTAVSCAATSLIFNAILGWAPSYLMRAKAMTMSDIALYYSTITGIAGAIGTFGGGLLVDRLARRDPRAYALVPAVAMVIGLPFLIAFVQTPDWFTATIAVALAIMSAGSYTAPSLALIQNSVPASQRAFTAATLSLFMTIFGVGVGPLLVGAISDAMQSRYGAQSLSIGFYALVPVYVLSIGANLAVARVIGRQGGLSADSEILSDLAAARARDAAGR